MEGVERQTVEGHVSQFAEWMIDLVLLLVALSLAGFLVNKPVYQLVQSSLAYEPIWVDQYDHRLIFW